MLNDYLQTRDVVSPDVDTSALDLNIYTSVVYAFLVIAAIFVIVAFFGCCGAWKVENGIFFRDYYYDLLNALRSSILPRPDVGEVVVINVPVPGGSNSEIVTLLIFTPLGLTRPLSYDDIDIHVANNSRDLLCLLDVYQYTSRKTNVCWEHTSS